MKGNNKFKKIINNINTYISNNKLFISYIIISFLQGLLLRIMTIGFSFSIQVVLSELMIIIVLGAFGYLIKSKNKFIYFFIWILFNSLLCIGNTIYYEFYKSFLSINLLSTASMIGGVNDALFDKIRPLQFIYVIFPIIFYYVHSYLKKKKYYENTNNNRNKYYFKNSLKASISLFIIILLLMVLTSIQDFSRFVKVWNREYIVQKYGIYVYTISDLIQSAQPTISNLFGYDEAILSYKSYYSCKWTKKKDTNQYTGIFKGKNVIFIHAESIQNFLIDLKINNKYVTPNFNRLASEGIYFNSFYPQISVGTSSDTEFTLTTGLMPSSSGTVFVNYYNRDYASMIEYFNDLGYYTFSAHGNNREYWNRNTMYKTLGYKDFYAKDNFIVPLDTSDPDYVGLGLSDKSFFKQMIPILKNIKNSNPLYFGTLITLSNHSPFNDLDHYGEFDVTMKYNINGELEIANYLEGSNMGDYIKSSHYADEALGLLFNELESNNLLENTIFIIYGDHEARLSKHEFDLLYNYDPLTDSIKDSSSEDYVSMDNYNYELLKNTPLIIWSSEYDFKTKVSDVMGMYDVLPTIANMFGFEEKYSLGSDIFSDSEKIVVFPNGNVITNYVYYSNVKNEYISLTTEPISSDYIERIKEYASDVLGVSNGIITHDLISEIGYNVGECTK